VSCNSRPPSYLPVTMANTSRGNLTDSAPPYACFSRSVFNAPPQAMT